MSNTPSPLMQIIKKIGYDCDGNSPELSDQTAEQAILTLFMECLPEQQTMPIQMHAGGSSDLNTLCKQHNAIGHNNVIDVTAQNMRALGSSDAVCI